MIEITTSVEARNLIENNKFVSFIWHSKTCLVCDYFFYELQGIEDDCPEFIHVMIDKDKFDGDTMFIPSQFPWTYIFKDGERISSPAGQAPKEQILSRYNDIVNGTFKTPEQIEQEYIDLHSENASK